METTANYRLIGLFTLVAVAAVFGFVYWLNNAAGLSERAAYRIQFEGAVPGLRTGAAVLFNGIRVGEVTALRLDSAKPNSVTVTVAVEKGTPIRVDTRASLDFQGLTGVTSVSLKGGVANAAALTAVGGESPLLTADAGAGADMTTAARDALRRVDTVLGENSDALRSTISNLKTFSDALARNSDRVDNIVAGLERMTGGDSAKAPPAIYDLTAAKAFPPNETPLRGQLAVAEPTAIVMFDTQKLLLRKGETERSPIAANAQWSDTLPKLIQAKIIQSFENANALGAVSRAVDGSPADFQLMIDIRQFEVVAGTQPAANVEFSAKLLGEGGRVLGAKLFHATAQSSATEAPAVAAALNDAFGKAARELVLWARTIIR